MSKTKERTKPCGSPLGDNKEDRPLPAGKGFTYVSDSASGEKVAGGATLRKVLENFETGYDYDKIRCAQHLYHENIENMTRLFLEMFMEFHNQTLIELKASTDLTTKEKVMGITKLADAFNKMIKVSSKAAPGLYRLGVALEIISEYVNYVIKNHDTDTAKSLVDTIEPFGQELARKWS